MTPIPLEDLFLRYRSDNDLQALGQVFDRTAPHLLSLAHRLAGKQADDVLQDTFLAAIENSAAWNAERPLVPWLMGILTHRAQRTWKEASRQPDFERLPETEVRTPDSLVMAKEFQASLKQALESLSPVLRQTVNASLFEGQTPTQLAVNLGLEPGTIRQRLRRGLGELRLALKGTFLLLFGLFGLRSNGLAATRTRILQEAARGKSLGMAASTGVAASVRWAGLFILLAGVTAIASPLWDSLGQQDSEHNAVNLAQSDIGRNQAEATLQAPANPTRTPSSLNSESVEPDLGRALSIQVRWQNSEDPVGVRNITVRYYGQESRSFQTNAHGQIRINLTSDDRPSSLDVGATEDSPGVERFIGTSQFKDLITLEVHRGGSLSGQVVDLEGEPVAHAVVQAWQGKYFRYPPFRTVQADKDGRFLLPHISEVCIIAHAKGMAGQRGLKGKVGFGDELVGHTLIVAPEATVAGVVLQPDGTPAEGAKLAIRHRTSQFSAWQQTHDGGIATFEAGSGEAVSNADGGFRIKGLPLRNHSAMVRLAPFLELQHSLGPLPAQNSIQLDAGESLSGTVLDSNGQPIPEAEVCYWPYFGNRQTTPYWNAVSAIDGNFTLSGLLPPSGRPTGLAVRAPGYSVLVMTPMPESNVRIKLLPEKRLRGRVLLGNGTPAANILVRIQGDRLLDLGYTSDTAHTWEKMAKNNETRTDAEGKFEFGGLYPGLFAVKVFADEGKQHWLEQTTTSGASELEFILTEASLRKVVIHPKVLNGLTGKPIVDFRLSAYETKDGIGDGYGRNLSKGEFGLEATGIEPGLYYFVVSKEGFVRARSEERFFGIGDHKLTFALWPMRTIEVHGVDQDGTRIANLDVRGTGPDGADIIFRYAGGGGRGAIQTTPSNAFMHGLPAGKVVLRVECEAGVQEISLDLTEPRQEPVRVVFQKASQVDVTGVTIALWFAKPPSEFSPGDKATIQARMLENPMLSRANLNAFRSALDHQLSTPTESFVVVIERPFPAQPIRVTYEPDGSVQSDPLATTLDSDTEAVHKTMGLTVHLPKPKFAARMTTTMTTTEYPLASSTRDPREPLAIDFPTPIGECTLKLESDYYEHVEFTWQAEELGERMMPPILILKAKK